MKETWINITDYSDYSISSTGRIQSNKSGRLLKQILHIEPITKYKKYRIGLYKSKKQKWFSVSRLVAIHFIPNPSKHPIVKHNDGNSLNNSVTNLSWGTHQENMDEWANSLPRTGKPRRLITISKIKRLDKLYPTLSRLQFLSLLYTG